jgi:hypothetical protein
LQVSLLYSGVDFFFEVTHFYVLGFELDEKSTDLFGVTGSLKILEYLY